MPRSARPYAALLVTTALVVMAFVPDARGSALTDAIHRRKHLAQTVSHLRKEQERKVEGVLLTVRWVNSLILANPPRRWSGVHRAIAHLHTRAAGRVDALGRRYRRRLRTLSAMRANVVRWIQTYGVLRTCPVPGWLDVSDDFGALVRLPHVPVHLHQGNDIAAYYGTPVVAPFPGVAVAVPNRLGGIAVDVFGERGFVYNAHLSRYGMLGQVHTGSVIGYVGATGDAGGTHDHFEWHPGNGPAVDPHAFLMAVC